MGAVNGMVIKQVLESECRPGVAKYVVDQIIIQQSIEVGIVALSLIKRTISDSSILFVS